MPRAKRCDGFVMVPEAVLTDPEFIRMDHRAQRAYLILVLSAWREKEPGVLPYMPRRLAHLVGESPQRWRMIEPQLVRAVKVREDGAWVFPAMVAAKLRQDAAVSAGRSGARARWLSKSETSTNRSRNPRETITKPEGFDNETKGFSGAKSLENLKTRDATALGTGSGAVQVQKEEPKTSPAAISDNPPIEGPIDPRALVRSIAQRLSIVPPKFPDHDAWKWVTQELQTSKPKEVMQMLGRLWKLGHHDLKTACSIVESAISRNPRNPWAYIESIRHSIADSLAIQDAEQQQLARSLKERKWLAQR